MKISKQLLSLCLVLFSIFLASSSFAGQTLSYKELQDVLQKAQNNKIVVLNFYASWCPPCREEVPHLIELRKKYSPEELEIIAINYDKSLNDMQVFNKAKGINYSTFRDDGSLQHYYKVRSIPFTVIYGKSGDIVLSKVGFVDGTILENAIKQGQ